MTVIVDIVSLKACKCATSQIIRKLRCLEVALESTGLSPTGLMELSNHLSSTSEVFQNLEQLRERLSNLGLSDIQEHLHEGDGGYKEEEMGGKHSDEEEKQDLRRLVTFKTAYSRPLLSKRIQSTNLSKDLEEPASGNLRPSRRAFSIQTQGSILKPLTSTIIPIKSDKFPVPLKVHKHVKKLKKPQPGKVESNESDNYGNKESKMTRKPVKHFEKSNNSISRRIKAEGSGHEEVGRSQVLPKTPANLEKSRFRKPKRDVSFYSVDNPYVVRSTMQEDDQKPQMPEPSAVGTDVLYSVEGKKSSLLEKKPQKSEMQKLIPEKFKTDEVGMSQLPLKIHTEVQQHEKSTPINHVPRMKSDLYEASRVRRPTENQRHVLMPNDSQTSLELLSEPKKNAERHKVIKKSTINFIECMDLLPTEKCIELDKGPDSQCDKAGQVRNKLCRRTCHVCQGEETKFWSTTDL